MTHPSQFLDENPARWIHLESVESTNSFLLKHPHPSGTVALARHQTAGRGRKGRVWMDTDDGSFLFSGYLEIPAHSFWHKNLPYLPLLAGLSTLQAVERVLADIAHPGSDLLDLRLKWPNDLYLIRNERAGKLAGVLVESEFRGDTPLRLVIGIGLNWAGHPPGDIATGPGPAILFPEGSPLPPSHFAPYLVKEINRNLAMAGSIDPLLDEVRRRCYLKGRFIRMGGLRYRVEGIAQDGSLRLQSLDTGTEKILYDTTNDFEILGAEEYPSGG